MRRLVGKSYRSVARRAMLEVLRSGLAVSPRSMPTHELEAVSLVVTDPLDRAPLLDERRANIFATIAETVWVLAGRDDIAFMEYFLSRIRDYSDDGNRLGGAYGPRLRYWRGQDQLGAARATLISDRESRRAVVSLFDPAVDGCQARRDIPCNNWLQFLVRNERLDLLVVSRSMDVFWGSVIDVHLWTVVQELMAGWLGVNVGVYEHFVGSLHLYDSYAERAQQVVAARPVKGLSRGVPWVIRFDEVGDAMTRLCEWAITARRTVSPAPFETGEMLLRNISLMLLAHVHIKNGRWQEASGLLAEVQDRPWKRLGSEFLSRQRRRGAIS